MRSAVALGTEVESGGKIVLDPKALETHLHVIGSSGTGKSYFLEHMIRRQITSGAGVFLLDPHGETYDNLVAWLATSGIRTNGLHLINPGAGDHSVGINPFCLPTASPSRKVADMLNAFMRVWGGTDPNATPRLRKCLRNTFYALTVHQLSLLEGFLFTSPRFKRQRQKLTNDLPIWEYSDEWAEFDAYSDREYREYFESARSRLIEFVTSPALRPILGQTENVLDLRACMDKGHVVLVNLSDGQDFSPAEAQVLGAMLLADLYSSAKQRPREVGKRKPFYAYIDECAEVINADIAKSLDQTRKFGLHFILSHQRLNQLREAGEDIFEAVMANAQTKVVFRIDHDDNAEELSRALLRSEFDLERRKENLTNPVAVGSEITTLRGGAEGETYSKTYAVVDSTGTGKGSSEGSGAASGISMFHPETGQPIGQTLSDSTSQMSGNNQFSTTSRSMMESGTEGRTTTESWSESLQTIYEERGIPYTLEEIRHLAVRAVRELPYRTAIVRAVGQRPKTMYTVDIKNRKPLQRQIDYFTKGVHTRSSYTAKSVDILKGIEERRDDLLDLEGTAEARMTEEERWS